MVGSCSASRSDPCQVLFGILIGSLSGYSLSQSGHIRRLEPSRTAANYLSKLTGGGASHGCTSPVDDLKSGLSELLSRRSWGAQYIGQQLAGVLHR
jgi:hypothetical protein